MQRKVRSFEFIQNFEVLLYRNRLSRKKSQRRIKHVYYFGDIQNIMSKLVCSLFCFHYLFAICSFTKFCIYFKVVEFSGFLA